MPKDSIISMKDISLKIGAKQILREVSKDIMVGEKFLVRGTSGSGKTSILRMIMGFLPYDGQLSIKGTILSPHTVWACRKNISYVGQATNVGQGSVENIYERILGFSSIPKAAIEDSRRTWWDRFQLDQVLWQQDFNDLSGGEKQRALLSLVLLLDRPLILLDEVTSALDPKLSQIIMEILMDLDNKTLIMVTHDESWLSSRSVAKWSTMEVS